MADASHNCRMRDCEVGCRILMVMSLWTAFCVAGCNDTNDGGNTTEGGSVNASTTDATTQPHSTDDSTSPSGSGTIGETSDTSDPVTTEEPTTQGPTTEEPTTEEPTTEEPTTEEPTTEEPTTEEPTTEEPTTEEPTTEEPTTEEPTTEEPTTEEPPDCGDADTELIMQSFVACDDPPTLVGQIQSAPGVTCADVCCVLGFDGCAFRAGQSDFSPCMPNNPPMTGTCMDVFQAQWSSQCMCT